MPVEEKNYTFSSYSGQLLVGTPVTQTTTATPLTSFEHVTGQKAYELSNHLGNVLVVVSDARQPINGSGSMSATVISYSAMVVSATDYSAFGAPMVGRTFSSTSYRYGFNGKENDHETVGTGEGTQDYGMRIYNPSLGRFLSVDPITSSYPELTPYQFASNTPIGSIDLDGLEQYIVTYHYGADNKLKSITVFSVMDAQNVAVDLNLKTPGGVDLTTQKVAVFKQTDNGAPQYLYSEADFDAGNGQQNGQQKDKDEATINSDGKNIASGGYKNASFSIGGYTTTPVSGTALKKEGTYTEQKKYKYQKTFNKDNQGWAMGIPSYDVLSNLSSDLSNLVDQLNADPNMRVFIPGNISKDTRDKIVANLGKNSLSDRIVDPKKISVSADLKNNPNIKTGTVTTKKVADGTKPTLKVTQ